MPGLRILFPPAMIGGIFELAATVVCDKGALRFTSSGSCNKNGFDDGGVISENGRSRSSPSQRGRGYDRQNCRIGGEGGYVCPSGGQ